MPLGPGSRLGSYEILAPLGSGGMGEVYRARDAQLRREVAIKVLPDVLARDPERLARFAREARLLAALNHSGIAAIFGVEDTGTSPALVMELVEGPTLAERIARGPLPLAEMLPLARQLAEALEYAHDRGIVHRDLKPANIKLRPDGTLKVLDFGLARALVEDAADPAGDPSRSPTLTLGATGADVILGTAAYMSPEQARGKPADRRADVWAFGAVLYEALSGRRAFAGESVSDTLASVMRDDPDWSALPADLPAGLRQLLMRCLAKDPRQRLQAIGEARIVLEGPAPEASRAATPAAPGAPRPRFATLLPWLIALAALTALAALSLKRPVPAPAATEVSVTPPGGERVGFDVSYHPLAISPDGRTLAYTVRVAGVLRLRLRRLDTREDVEIAGTEGARNLFFSPDGQWIGFFNSRKMCKVSVRGGTPVALADAQQDRLGTWLDDGTIVYSREATEPLYRISGNGGSVTTLTMLDSTRRERTHRFPCALDGGPWVVFTSQTVESPGGYDDASIEAVSVKTGERRHLYKGARRAVWAPGGYLILARGNDLYATPIDPRDPRLTRDPVPVMVDVNGTASSGASFFSIAGDGTLAWIPGGEPDRDVEVGWIDRTGRWTPIPIAPGPHLQLQLSPDRGRALVLSGPGGGASDLWVADLSSGATNRLTHGMRAGAAVWLADGVRFVYSRGDSAGGETVLLRRLDGAGGERMLYHAGHPLNVTAVTPGAPQAVFCDYGVRTGRIHLVALEGDPVLRSLPVEGDGYEQAGMPSPDGRWLAYVTNKTGREEVGLRRLDGVGGSWQVSTGGAGGIRWGRGGRELFFIQGDRMMRVSLEIRAGELVVGQPEELFEVPPSMTEPTFGDHDYDPVGDRFLFSRPLRGSAARREVALSLGWAKRLPEMLRSAATQR